MLEKKAFDESMAVSRREQNKVDTRRRILAAAARLMSVHGLEATTAEAIAAAAEVSRATFFNYFPSKSAVSAALVAKFDDDFATTVDLIRHTHATTAERLEHLFVQTATRLQSSSTFHKMLLSESERGYSQTAQSSQRVGRMHSVLGELLADGVARGEVRTDYTLALIAEIVGGSYASLLHNWRIMADYPLEDRMQESARFLADAIAPPKTGKLAQPIRRVEKQKK